MTNRTPQRITVGSRWRGFSNPHRVLCALLASLQLLLPSLVAALPSDGNVVGGNAAIQQVNPKQLNIQQATDKAILNWKSFSIAADEAVHFVQPSVNSIALNRVIGTDPSVILGQLQSNGRIFLLNPNGILFGAGAQINVGGLLATTLQIRDDDFMAGRYLFAQDPLKGLKSVVNQGTIHVSDHGFVVLAAPGVSNEGMIVANLGTTVLASGKTVTVDLMGDGLINYVLSEKVLDQVMGPDGKPLSSAVSNTGTIQADGGHVILQAKASGDIFSSVVNQSGVIRARSLENHGGMVQLLGGDGTLVAATAAGAMRPAGDVSGAVVNRGTIDVAAGAPNAAQGSVTMVGERVGQFGSIVATGAEGANGGEVVIASTTRTLLASGSTIDVSGINHSSGGRLRVWSDRDTFFDGGATILARGGELGGNGGFVELSGKENLGYAGTVNALAPFGSAGTLLLDPRNITIQTAGGSAYNPGVNNLFGNTPAADVIITPASINAAAANVVLQANNDITVTNAIAMINSGVGITLQAGRDILVNAGVSTTNGNISMTANDSSSILANRTDGTAGDIIFGVGANLSSGTGNITLTIDPATAGNYDPGSITTVRNLTTTTGNITLNSLNTVSLSGAVNAGSAIVSINANSDGAGAQNFTMNAGSSIATTNTGANAVQVIVNSPTGGTGAASLRGSITTGNGGTATVSTRGQAAVGGNITGGAITQGAVLTMNTGVAGTIALATGAAASSITLNTVGNDFTGAVGVSRAFNVALQDANALTLGASTISGTLGVTTAGALTQTGALTVTGTTTLAAGAANNITLNNAGNNFSTVAITNGNNVALTDANALVLGASTVSGTLGVTTAGAVTQTGALAVTGATTVAAGAANNITLNNAANNFSTVGITSGNNVALTDANALVLGASTVNGALALTTGGALTQSGALNVTGATSFTATAANTDILLGTQANNFGGALSFAGTLGNFRDVSIRNVNAGATVPALAGLTALRNLTLTYNNAPVALPALTLTAGGNLNVTAGGAITDSGNLIVPGTTTLAAGANNITLDNANNFTGAVSVTSGNNVALNDINALVLGPSTVSGTLNVTTAGAVTQTGALAVTGATTVAVGAANNITLNNAANNFSTVGITSGNNVALTDANALNLAASTVSGTFGVTTTGALTQSGPLTITGVTTLAAGAANNITLGGANNFSTVAVTSGNNVTLNDTNALILGASTISGTLGVTTAGAVTQTGALAVTGATTVAAGAANNITLNNAANNFSTVGITSGNNVALTDANALNLAASTVSGIFGVTTTGALTQSGPLTVIGTTTLASGAANNITLGGANNFSTVAVTSGNNVTLNDTNALILGASTISGTLGVTTAGALTQSGVLTVTGVTTLSAGAANNINLATSANNFSTVAITSGNNVSLLDTNALVLGTSTVSSALTLTTGGALTQSGALNVTGATSFTATAANTDILLGTQANNFGGALSFAGTLGNFRDVSIRNINAGATVPAVAGLSSLRNFTLQFDNAPITLPALTLTAGGNLNVTAGGTISQSGVLTVPGTTTLASTVAGSDILLNSQANNLTGAVIFAGTQSNIRDLGLRNVNAGATIPALAGLTSLRNLTLQFDNAPITLPTLTLTAGGNLNVTAGGSITETGAITVPGTTTLATTVAGSDILLNTQANNFGGAVSFGGTQSNIRDVGLRNVNAGATVPALAGLTNLRNLTLQFDSAPVTLPALTLTAGGSLNITAGGAITDSGNLLVPGTTILAAGANDIALDNANDFIGAVSIVSGNNVTLNDINALVLGPSTVSGALNVTTNGVLTQSGPLTVAGTTTLASGAANDITLTNAANNFSTIGITSGNSVSLTDANALVLGASTVSGNLALTTGGALSQTGALAVTGTTSFTATAANTDILLDTQTNNFGGALSFAGTQANFRDVQLRNVNAGATVPVLTGLINLRNLTLTFDNAAMTLPALTASGTLNLTAGGAINQSGVLAVGGTTTLATTVAGSDILLDTQANNLVGAISFGGTLGNIRDVGLRNTNAGATIPSLAGLTSLRNLTLTFDNAPVALPSLTLTAGGNLNVTAGGSITETGTVTVPGATTLATTVAGSDILLNTQANNFGGAIAFGGTQTNIRDLGLRNVNVGATVPALAALTNLRNLTLTFDTAPMVLPSLTASGNLTATAGGLISQSGALNVAGTASFDTIAAATLGSVTLANGGALTLNTSTVGGNLTVTTAAGDLTLPAGQTLTVGGDATLSPAGTVNLLGTTRIGGTQSSVGGTGSTFVLGADTNLNALALPAAGDITVNLTGITASFAGAPLLPQAITLGNAGNSFGGPVSVTTAAPAFTGTTTNTYNLTQSAPVNLNVGQGLTVTDLGGTAGTRGNITLTNAGNIFNTVTFTGGNIAWAETGPVTIGGVSANAGATSTGTLSITATGLITQTGAVTTGGASTVAAGANDITLTNAANNFSTVGITSGNNVALTDANALDLGASTISGTLNLTVNGALTQSGALAVTGTTTLAAGAANDITLNNAANNFSIVGITSGNNVTLVDTNVLNLAASTVSGTLNVTAGGLISQSGALSVAGNASFDTTAAATLGSVTLANGGGLTLGTSTVGGNLVATTTAGDFTLPVGQTLTVVGDATLAPAGNVNLLGTTRIGGTQTLNGGTGSTFVLAADTNLNSLALPAAGDITVNTTGTTASFAGGPILPVAINLSNASNSFGSSVQVTTAAPAFTGSMSATYNLTQSALVSLNAGQTMTVTDLGGTAGTRGNITLTNAGNSFNTVNFTGGNIAWQEANAVTIGTVSANAGITSSGALSITANGPITQTATVTAAGTTSLAAGANDITLINAANNFGTVSISSGNNVSLTDANALDLGASSIAGTLNLTVNGALTQSGALTVAGATTLAAGAANDITLNNAANNFSIVGITSGNNVTLVDTNVLNLAASTVSGNLTATTGGTLTQSGALTVTGTTNLASTAANSDILLDTQANNFGGAVAFGGIQANVRDVSLRNVNAGATVPALAGLTNLRNLALTFDAAPINLPTLNASGNLSATAGGSITQSGALTVGGATTLATTVAGSDILLDTQANDFGGAVAFGGTQTNIRDIGLRNLNAGATIPALAGVTNLRNLTLTFDNAPIALPSLTTSGNLNATAGGTITQTGALTIAGITTLAAGANDITLNNAANNFSTVGITSGNNVSLTDANALNFAASTVSGTLGLTANGDLTQSGALNVTGTTTLAVGAVNDITLTNAVNNFSTVGITSGNNVALTDANALMMNASTVAGNFTVNASDLTVGGSVTSTGGNLNLSGSNTVAQLANLTAAGANAVTVTTTTGAITMAAAATTSSGTGTITYTAGTDVTLGSLSTSGGVNVSAGGSVLSAAGSGTNVTAGANSTLQAFNGVVGTSAAPVTVNVNPGTLSIRATTSVAGISAFLTGTVLPSNALTLLNVPPGLVCFNGCPSNNPFGGFFGLIPSFNRDSAIPWYLREASDPPLISVVSTYLPGTVITEAITDVRSDKQSVAREIPPCFPKSACKPRASILTAPADGEDPELSAAK